MPGRARVAVFRPALACAAVVLIAACATNPVTGKREFTLMSESQEIQLGLQSDAEIRREMGLYDDPALQQYVQGIGKRLAATSERPKLPWQFAVVDVAAVNAFALPGGYIYVTRGILPYMDNEAELAGVIGHEIGHVTARHSAQQYTRAVTGQVALAGLGVFVPETRPFGQAAGAGLGLLFLKYGRDDELQADSLGARYAMAGGWSPEAVPAFLATLGRLTEVSDKRGIPGWLQTHPQPADRVQKIQASAREMAAASGRSWQADRDAYLRRVDGIMFGDNPREGLVRGAEFVHPDLRFALAFPQGWQVNNGKAEVVAKAPNADVFMLLQVVDGTAGRSLQDVAPASMQKAGFRMVEGQQTTINGLRAFVGRYAGTMEGLGATGLRAAHVVLGERVFLLAGLAGDAVFAEADPAFSRAIRSFRQLSAGEAADVRPNRVDVQVARGGDTWQSIARRTGDLVTPATLAILNGRSPQDSPPVGTRLKVVVAG